MTDEKLKDYLFDRYTNMVEYWREEIADETFCPKVAIVDAMASLEQQYSKLEDEEIRLRKVEESWRLKMWALLKGLGIDLEKSHDWDEWPAEALKNLGERHRITKA